MSIEKIQQLHAEIIRHDHLYDENRPEISDTEYDKLFKELVAVEKQHPELDDLLDSPTHRIHTAFNEALSKRKLKTPLISLKKAHRLTDEEVAETGKDAMQELIDFVNSVNDPNGYVTEHKGDGLTIEVDYDGGQLTEAITRGNGEIGEIVTHTVKEITNLPKAIPFNGTLRVRGESVIPWKDFERINVNGEYSHPRNLASGTIRQLDSSFVADRGMQFLAYDIIEINGHPAEFVTDMEQLAFLEANGFAVMGAKHVDTLDQLIETCVEMENTRATLPYAIDGAVIKANTLALRDKLGQTAKYPRWAIAFKFEAFVQFTTLRAVEWQVGKSGTIAPVAVFDPIDLDGAITTRATLHNIGFIRDMDLHLGDTISVARANDVIPKVLGVVTSVEQGEFIATPSQCPSCGTPLVIQGAYLMCSATETCLEQRVGRLIHFASRNALDIEGLGDVVARQLIGNNLVNELSDVFSLNADQLLTLEKFGKRKAEKLLDAIEKAKSREFAQVLYSLAIPLVGRTASKVIASTFGDLDHIRHASIEELEDIEGIGAVVANRFYYWISDHGDLLESLRDAGVAMTQNKKVVAGHVFQGMSVVITGTLSQPRSYFEQLVESNGGKNASSVSAKTTFVLAGENAGSKLDKAAKLNVPVWTEAQFLQTIQDAK
jgi:DNA ligase (NAD+)